METRKRGRNLTDNIYREGCYIILILKKLLIKPDSIDQEEIKIYFDRLEMILSQFHTFYQRDDYIKQLMENKII